MHQAFVEFVLMHFEFQVFHYCHPSTEGFPSLSGQDDELNAATVHGVLFRVWDAQGR